MQAATDTIYWPQLVPALSEFVTATWAGPDGAAWQEHDIEELLRATPPGKAVAIWSCDTPQPGDNRLAALKRSFRGGVRLHKASRFSRNLHVQNCLVWFDLAVVDMSCVDELTDLMQRGLGFFSGMALINATDDPSDIGKRTSAVLEEIWNRIEGARARSLQPRRGRTIYEPWSDVERARLIRDVPGHVLVALDRYTTTRYIIGVTPSTTRWLTAAGRTQLNIERVWKNGVDLLDPAVP